MSRRVPVVVSKRYAAPALIALVSSNSAPTKAKFPEMETEPPKRSLVAGVGFENVTGVPSKTGRTVKVTVAG